MMATKNPHKWLFVLLTVQFNHSFPPFLFVIKSTCFKVNLCWVDLNDDVWLKATKIRR